jgi:hypothetical protein
MSYEKLLKECINPFLKSNGYKKKGSAFYRTHSDGNVSVFDFQKSRKSEKDQTVFTINIAISSRRIATFHGNQTDNPVLDDCHWKTRIGHLLPEKQDLWWTIVPTTVLNDFCSTILGILDRHAFKAISEHDTDQRLRDYWLSGNSAGLTNIQRLINLSILLKAIGPQEKLSAIIEEMKSISRGQATEFTVEDHLSKLKE